MAQAKVYRNCSNLTTPPAIQGPRSVSNLEKDKQGRSPHDSLDATGHSGL